MLRSLTLKNFTVFRQADLQFGRNLNVIVGENGTGKTHILKAAYCLLAVSARGKRDSASERPTKSYFQVAMASKLRGVFRPGIIGHLARRPLDGRTEVRCDFDRPGLDFAFSFTHTTESEVAIDSLPSGWVNDTPVYLPTHELLTVSPAFVSIFETTHLPFDETWRDTAVLLGAPLARGARADKMRPLLEPLQEAMGGTIEVDDAGFYIKTKQDAVEVHLVAEGHRKLGMLARLIASGQLTEGSCLFWDEPDANLNAKLVKLVARTVVGLSQRGIQIFLATHSLFLLRELYILQQEAKSVQARFIGLHMVGDRVEVEQGETMDHIGDITALDEELKQSERYMTIENEAR